MAIIEDAFKLARTGNYKSVAKIAKALKSRGYPIVYVEDHLIGKRIRAELTRACREAISSKAK